MYKTKDRVTLICKSPAVFLYEKDKLLNYQSRRKGQTADPTDLSAR